jgi:signal transduction histidine kinase
MADLNSSEKAHMSSSPEKATENRLIVTQPPKMKELGQVLDAIDNMAQRVGERTSEDVSGDLGSSGGSAAGQKRASPRDAAIALMPTAPAVLQAELAKHIEQEIKQLERKVSRAGAMSKAGGAYELNELYARIRKLRSLLREILEASVDLLKSLFIKVFIDKQPIQ